jgi:hypothetical protein
MLIKLSDVGDDCNVVVLYIYLAEVHECSKLRD